MSNQQTLNQFFATKVFEIPKYQRSFAWEKENIRELYEDIIEAIDTKSSHYIGTIVLAKTDRTNIYNVVDGQQRLTTLVMFISVIISKLDVQEDRDYWRRYYVQSREQFKLTPLDRDKEFYFKLLLGQTNAQAQNKSQRFMLDAYEEMHNILKAADIRADALLQAIGDLYVLEFVEDNESDAIRIFQTVNDRGKELSRMDKMKSLLFYFSNKYCGRKYDDEINDTFAEVFELYHIIKHTGESLRINVISSKQFSEDDLLRQHHICFSEESYDPTGQQVLDNVKQSLLAFRRGGRLDELSSFICGYLDSLVEYIRAFREVIGRALSEPLYYKLFSVLGLSAAYYPIVTMLQKNGFLEKEIESKRVTVLELIEIIDVRVMKVRQYAGRKDIAEFAYQLNTRSLTFKDVTEHLLWFNSHKIGDDKFRDALANSDFYSQTGLLRTLFIDYSERLNRKAYDIVQLKKIMEDEPTIEHILSQSPKFKPKSYGFKSDEEFEEFMNRLGNLTLLEKRINSSVSNQDLVEKIAGYSKSRFKMTTELATALSTAGSFKKESLRERNLMLVEDFSIRWWAEGTK